MEEILRLFPEPFKILLSKRISNRWDQLQEIRLRVQQPIELNYDDQIEWVDELSLSEQDCHFILSQLCDFSVYRMEEELRQGFVTIRGGHRVGLAGTATVQQGSLQSLKHISFFNIRIAKEKYGSADQIMPYIHDGRYRHTLLAGPPKAGKTTLLRDLARQIAAGSNRAAPHKVAIIDERSEIAASWNGVAQHSVGRRTDILDSCPKSAGMLLMIRSMSPEVIITDEIGRPADVDAIGEAANAGITVITTVHARNMEELRRRPSLRPLWDENIFERIVFLNNNPFPGHVQCILDGHGNRIVMK